jgi:heat shock protein HtpX
MATLYNHQDKNIRLTWFYISIFLVLIIAVGYTFASALGSSAILYGAVIFSVVMSVSSYWFSDSIVLKMSNAHPLDRNTHLEIYRLVENLAITAGLPMPKLYIMEDSALNAFATGRNPEHGVVCLTTGIIARLEPNELEGVIAHELSHIGNRDTLISTVVVVLVGFIAIVADWFRYSAVFGGRSDNREGGGIGMVIAILVSLLAPLAAMMLQLAISRKREFLADASGALLTRYPEGLASALEKIGGDATPLESANSATAHLYISNPLRGQKFSKLFMTHPPMEERIAALRGMEIQ